MRLDEAIPRQFLEIEFLCVNSEVDGSATQEQHNEAFEMLQNIPGVLVYQQDFTEEEAPEQIQKSMAVIILNGAGGKIFNDKIEAQIKDVAKKCGLSIDLYQPVSEFLVDKIVAGKLPYLSKFKYNPLK